MPNNNQDRNMQQDSTRLNDADKKKSQVDKTQERTPSRDSDISKDNR